MCLVLCLTAFSVWTVARPDRREGKSANDHLRLRYCLYRVLTRRDPQGKTKNEPIKILRTKIMRLPTNEEINIKIYHLDLYEAAHEVGFRQGAVWMRDMTEKILASEEKAVNENERREELKKFLYFLHVNNIGSFWWPDDDHKSTIDKFLNSK